ERHVPEREHRRLRRQEAQRRAQARRLLRREVPLDGRRQRRGAEPEEPLRLALQPLREPRGSVLHPSIGGEPPGKLLGSFFRLELRELERLLREEAASLELEQRSDQDEELPARGQVEAGPVLQPLAEREHDLRDIDLRKLELLAEHQRQQQVERPLEGVEVKLELTHDHGRETSDVTGRDLWAQPSPGRWA